MYNIVKYNLFEKGTYFELFEHTFAYTHVHFLSVKMSWLLTVFKKWKGKPPKSYSWTDFAWENSEEEGNFQKILSTWVPFLS